MQFRTQSPTTPQRLTAGPEKITAEPKKLHQKTETKNWMI